MQAIRQYAEVENGYLHVKLPENFTEKNVEIIILTPEKRSEVIVKKENKNELSRLAGTWSNEALEEFNQATSYFNQIETELWK